MSYNILNGIRQGEIDAKKAEQAKRRGSAAGRGGGRAKSGFPRSAGRAAIDKSKMRGRGCSMDAHNNRKGFSRTLKYVDKKDAELIFENGDLRSMRACAALRPDIAEPCAHFSISLPLQAEKLTKEDWKAIIETARKALGIDDSFPMVAMSHHDTEHQHGHMVVCRVSVTGKVLDQTNIGLKCAAIERILEDVHHLKLVHPSEYKNHNNKLTKNEIEMSTRTHQKPPRLLIADALKIAVQGRPTVQQFVERLNSANIGVRANVASTGRMNGFSFIYQGVPFSGSKVSKEFGWQQLQERIEYVEIEDREFLRSLHGETGPASDYAANAIATIDSLDRAIEQVGSPAAEPARHTSSDPAVARPTSQTVEQSKPAKPALTEKPVPGGFRKLAILDTGLRGWAGSLPNRIARRVVATDKNQQRIARALYDNRDRAAAILDATGDYAIPEIRHLTDEQISSLLRDLGGDDIKVSGTPDFCARVEEVANQNGLKVIHEYQVTQEERKAAELRIAAREREELALRNGASNLPGYAPK